MDTEGVRSRIQDFKRSRLLILVDDTSPFSWRGALVSPAEEATPELMNRVASIAHGLFCVAISPERAETLLLGGMTGREIGPSDNQVHSALKFLTSVEAREGVTTGISAADRARTVAILGERPPSARKLIKPGHIFPVAARAGGLLIRSGLPEGACDLVRTAGFSDAALFVDLLSPSGELMNEESLAGLSSASEIPLLTLSDLTRYRLETETLVTRVAEATVPTKLAGEIRTIVFRSEVSDGEHVALVKGELDPSQAVLTRVQPEFTFGDVFGGENPPSRSQLDSAMEKIGKRGRGVIVYLRRTSPGVLGVQVASWEKAYNTQPASMMREYGLGAQILRDLGVRQIELLTNSKKNLVGLKTFGIEIVKQSPLFGEQTA